MKLVYQIKTEEINPKPNRTQKSTHPSIIVQPPQSHQITTVYASLTTNLTANPGEIAATTL